MAIELIQSFTIDHDNLPQAGVGAESRVVLIAKSALASYTLNGIDQVTALTLAANKSAFSFEGVKQSAKPRFERVQTASSLSAFRHFLDFIYFSYDQIAKNNSSRMARARFVAIMENSKIDGNTIEVYGINVGLEVVDMKRTPLEADGGIQISLATPENEYEDKPPRTFDAGTGIYATNRTAIDALLFLPTIGATGLSITTYPAATPTAIVITGTNFFAGGSNSGVLRVELVNNLTGAVIPFTAALTVTNTTITTTTPVAVALNNYKVRVRTTKGVTDLSAQNIITT